MVGRELQRHGNIRYSVKLHLVVLFVQMCTFSTVSNAPMLQNLSL